MFRRNSPLVLFIISLILLVVLVILGPSERTLGSNVRLVYLHGAWVWTALISFIAAGVIGVLGLLTSRYRFQRWSAAWGQVGVLFWVTYLPLSLWTMQTNWNGIYLAEPRWKIGVDFAIIGVLLQGTILLWRKPAWASAINATYLTALLIALASSEQVMHPPSPIFSSEARVIRLFFSAMVAVCVIIAWQLTHWLFRRDAST